MSLRDRLRRLEARAARTPRAGKEAGAPPEGAAARGLLPAALEVRESEEEGVVARVSRFSLEERHGRFRLGEILDVDAELLGRAARHGGPLPPRDALFLDTETTSLGGGAGVYVFLVGTLVVEEGTAAVEQLLLRGPHVEPAFLERVEQTLVRRGHLVTFFGKAFDRHRLDDRFALHTGRRPLTLLPHLDLYHVGRRLFRAVMPDTRLRTFERALLGVERVADLDGAECPDAYFDWLDGVDNGRMERVFQHNLIDVLSLLALSVRVSAALAAPAPGREAAASGLLLLDAGDEERAVAVLERAVAGLEADAAGVDPDLRRAALELAADRQRRGEGRAAVLLLERLAAALPLDAEPLLRAARIAERHLRERDTALDCARRALGRLEAQAGSRAEEVRERVRRQIERLRERE